MARAGFASDGDGARFHVETFRRGNPARVPGVRSWARAFVRVQLAMVFGTEVTVFCRLGGRRPTARAERGAFLLEAMVAGAFVSIAALGLVAAMISGVTL